MTSLDRIDVIIRYLLTTNYARGKNIVKTLYKRRTIHFPCILFVKMHQKILLPVEKKNQLILRRINQIIKIFRETHLYPVKTNF